MTIENTGTAPLSFTGAGIEITGTDAAEFAITNSPATDDLAPGASVTVDVAFDPSSDGAKTANLTITTSDPDSPTVDVALSGTGTTAPPVPDVSVTGGPLDFSTQGIGDGPTTAQTITITNNGTGPLNFTGAGIAIVGTDAAEFAIANSPATTALAPTESVLVEVLFDPTTIGVKSASVEITTDDPDSPTVQVTLAGEGVATTSVSDWALLDD